MPLDSIMYDVNRYVNLAQLIRGDASHQRRLRNYDFYDALYQKRHWFEPPADDTDFQISLPIHTIVVNTAHAILTGMPPTVRCYPNDPTSERQSHIADEIEQWHLAVDYDNAQQKRADEWELACFNQCLYGMGVMREVYDFPASWYAGKDTKLPRIPIYEDSVHPRQVFWRWGNPPRGRESCIFYEMEMTISDIETTFGVKVKLPEIDPAQGKSAYVQLADPYVSTRIVVDWWEWVGTDIYHCIFLYSRDVDTPGGLAQFIKRPTRMPEYSALPYHLIPFYQTTYTDYDLWALPVIYALTDIPHYLEVLASRKMRVVENYADPILVVKRGANSSGAAIDVEKRNGGVLELEPGDEAYYLQWQGSPPDDRYLWEKLEEIWHELSFSRVLMAQGSADATGFRTALDRETSLLKIAKGLQNLEDSRAWVYIARAMAMSKLSPDKRVFARGTDSLGTRVARSVNGRTLGQYLDITVEVRPKFPGDIQREIAVAQAAIAGNIWSIDRAMDYTQERDKQAMREQIIKDKIQFHPAIIDYHVQDLIKKLTQQKQEEEATSQGSLTNELMSGLPPAPGPNARPGPRPGIPGLPGQPGKPGQPAGPSGNSGILAGMANGPLAGLGPPEGTVTPQNLTSQLLGM